MGSLEQGKLVVVQFGTLHDKSHVAQAPPPAFLWAATAGAAALHERIKSPQGTADASIEISQVE